MKAIGLCLLITCSVLVASQSSKHDSPLNNVYLKRNSDSRQVLPWNSKRQMNTNVNAPQEVSGSKVYTTYHDENIRRHTIGNKGVISMKGLETNIVETPKTRRKIVYRRKSSKSSRRNSYKPNTNQMNLNINTNTPVSTRRFLPPIFLNKGARRNVYNRRLSGKSHFRRQDDVNQDAETKDLISNENGATSELRESSPAVEELNNTGATAERVTAEQATSELNSPESVTVERATAEQATAEQASAEEATAEQATAEFVDENDHNSEETPSAEANAEVNSEVDRVGSFDFDGVNSVENNFGGPQSKENKVETKMCKAANQKIVQFWKVVSKYLGLNDNRPKNLDEIKKLYIILRLYIELSKHKHLDHMPLDAIIDDIIKGLVESAENDDQSDISTGSDSDSLKSSEQQTSASDIITTPKQERSSVEVDDYSPELNGQIKDTISAIVDNLNVYHTVNVEDLKDLVNGIVLNLAPVGQVSVCQEKAYANLLENLGSVVEIYWNDIDCSPQLDVITMSPKAKRRLSSPVGIY